MEKKDKKKKKRKGSGKDIDEMDNVMLLGRPRNTLKMGIVGLPNVGKSLTFNALTELDVPSKNFAFCTKEPNKAILEIVDKRHAWLCEIYKPKKKMLAQL